jgi:hypothetical protein
MCEFVDDKASVFPFEELQRCMVDVMEEWEDFTPFADHPFGSRPVWIGYDPSHTGDSAGCVVLAPPVVSGGNSYAGASPVERHGFCRTGRGYP